MSRISLCCAKSRGRLSTPTAIPFRVVLVSNRAASDSGVEIRPGGQPQVFSFFSQYEPQARAWGTFSSRLFGNFLFGSGLGSRSIAISSVGVIVYTLRPPRVN